MTRKKKTDMQTPRVEKQSFYDDLFKGYGESLATPRNCLKDFDKVSFSNDLTGFLKDNIIMVDVDDTKEADIFLEVLQYLEIPCYYQPTTRGIHAFFQNDKVKRIHDVKKLTALGITIETKSINGGTQLSKTLTGDRLEKAKKRIEEGSYKCQLDENNVENRPILALNGGGVPNYPFWLTKVETQIDITGMIDGDGRNPDLYRYILPLLRYGLTVEQIKDTITLSNKFILGEPLKERELKVALRDDAFPSNDLIFVYDPSNPYDETKKGKLQFSTFAECFVRRYKTCVIENDEELDLYFFSQGVYKYLDFDTCETLQFKMYDGNALTDRVRYEIYRRIKEYSPVATLSEPTLLLFNNGVFDVTTGELREIQEDDVFINKIPYEYNNKSSSETLSKFLSDISCCNKHIEQLIIETIGYSLIRGNSKQVLFWFEGDGSNGKGTLFDLIYYTLGKHNCSRLRYDDLHAKFGLGKIRNKFINIGDEVDPKSVSSSTLIKSLSGHTAVKIEDKRKDAKSMVYKGVMFFSGNGIPQFKDTSTGLDRRLQVIPMDADFEKSQVKDVYFKDKLLTKETAEALLYRAVAAIPGVLSNGFTICDRVREKKEEFRREINPVLRFIDEYGDLHDKYVSVVYQDYKLWCMDEGEDSIKSRAFTMEIKKLGYTSTQHQRNLTKDEYERYRIKKDRQYKKEGQLSLIK